MAPPKIVRVVRVACSPVQLLDVLERAQEALARGEPEVGRRFVDHAASGPTRRRRKVRRWT